MIVYNVTVKVEAAIASQWLAWVTSEQAPLFLSTGCFWKYQLLHLLELDDAEGPTYAIQYYAYTFIHYQTFLELHAVALQHKERARWGQRFVSFSTVMEVVG